MTHKYFKIVRCGILDAIAVIDAILEKQVSTDGGDDNGEKEG